MRTTLLLLALTLLPALAQDEPAAKPADPDRPKREFYAFQNGLFFPSDDAAAQTLAELGYDGMGSANLKNLEKRIETYRKHKLYIHSIYVGATLKRGEPATLDPAIITAMGQLDHTAVVEFTLRGNPTDEEAAAFMRTVADQAAKHDLDVVLYPHTHFFVETIGDAVRIAKLADRDNLGAMFNLCHFLKVEPKSDLRATLEAAKPWLKQVSTNGADADGKHWPTLIQPLDKGSFEQESLFQILDDIGFTGKVGLQCYNVKGDAKTNLAASIKAWNALQMLTNKTHPRH